MQAQEKINPPREFCLELLNWAYKSTEKIVTNLDIEETTSIAKKKEKEIYIRSKNEKDYNEKIIDSINSIFKLDINQLNQKEQEKLITKRQSNFLKILCQESYKIGLIDKESIECMLFVAEKIPNFYQVLDEDDTITGTSFINETNELVKKEINASIDRIKTRSPKSLKEVSSQKLISNSLIFAKFNELIEKNEISYQTAEILLEDSRNVPNSFKELIGSKRKESLEKESMTNVI